MLILSIVIINKVIPYLPAWRAKSKSDDFYDTFYDISVKRYGLI